MGAETLWRPYPKIGETLAADVVPRGEWVATEKIHGANLGLVVCDGEVRAAKRKRLLEPDELSSFFGLSEIWPRLAAAALVFAGGEDMVIYGELCGGRQPVQTGVFYGNDLSFLAFDALLASDENAVWLADAELRARCAAACLVAVPLVARGRFSELTALTLESGSEVPRLLGSTGEPPNNLAEGVVLKPAGSWPLERPVCKRKHERFAEDERFHGARPYIVPSDSVPTSLIAEATALLTPARAASAVGKIGPAEPEAIVAELVFDLLAELGDRHGDLGGYRERLSVLIAPAAHILVTDCLRSTGR